MERFILGGPAGHCYAQFAGCDRKMMFDFAAPLTDAGGSILLTINTNERIEAINSSAFEERHISGGLIEATPVPVPQAVWLFGSAVGFLGWMRRKQSV